MGEYVTLTPSEMINAAMVGVMRQTENLKLGRKPAYGAGRDADWQKNIEGALGEAALAKHLGAFWLGTGKLRGFDVGTVDVRTSAHPRARLIIHPEDPDDRVFFLLNGINGVYDVCGYTTGKEAKNPIYWDETTGRPAYFVPREHLKQWR